MSDAAYVDVRQLFARLRTIITTHSALFVFFKVICVSSINHLVSGWYTVCQNFHHRRHMVTDIRTRVRSMVKHSFASHTDTTNSIRSVFHIIFIIFILIQFYATSNMMALYLLPCKIVTPVSSPCRMRYEPKIQSRFTCSSARS